MNALLDDLNPAQREAVTAPPGHYLILAGAGSGKTRVLTHRIAWLCEEQGLWPHNMLAVTFTNKAAGEMRERLGHLLHQPTRGQWVGTFHSIAHRLLRMHHQEAGLQEHFQILDSDDQIRVLKRVIQELELDDKRFPPKQAAWMINGWKDEALRPEQLPAPKQLHDHHWHAVYRAYEAACQRAGVVDFAELLLRAFEMLNQHDALRMHYQQRFQHVLIDEFQDTNTLQYAWVRQLVGSDGLAFVVGDDDQSIYSWRGAQVENMQRFLSDFPGARLIKLEQNYRSTGTILKAANALIERNQGRLGKQLWTAADSGEAIDLFGAHDESEEARHAIGQIMRFVEEGAKLRDCAILYRSNAQSRAFEEALIQKSLPYRVYGGLRFFERAEIKDALAYLRLLANPDDDPALERALNMPPRGIGDKTAEQLRNQARQAGVSQWRFLELQPDAFSNRARSVLSQFVSLIQKLRAETHALNLAGQMEVVLEHSGLRTHYEREQKETRLGADSRIENLDELLSVAARFQADAPERDVGSSELVTFLSYAALEAGEGQSQVWEDAVQLMTLHASKGLEFPLVCLSGLEEGLFPLQRAIDEGGQALEEERRLAYVGITRARRRLLISFAETRRRHGEFHYARPSRFVGEIPKSLLKELRPRGGHAQAPRFGVEHMETPSIRLGARVRHARFGEGIVLAAFGNGEHARVQVNFADVGTKELVLAFANLQLV